MSNIDNILVHMEENTAKYSIPLLSNKKEKFAIRVITTKDQKILAQEAEENPTDLFQFTLMIRLLDSCIVKNKTALGDILLEDFYWLVLNLRKKSLGETIELTGNCEKCDQKGNPVVIDLEKDCKEIYLSKIKKNIVDITNMLKISVKFVTLNDMVDILTSKETMADEKTNKDAYGLELSLAAMIDVVELEEEIIDLDSLEEKHKLLNGLSTKQLQKFKEFIEANKFGVFIKSHYKCKNPKCNHNNKLEMDGVDLIDFF